MTLYKNSLHTVVTKCTCQTLNIVMFQFHYYYYYQYRSNVSFITLIQYMLQWYLVNVRLPKINGYQSTVDALVSSKLNPQCHTIPDLRQGGTSRIFQKFNIFILHNLETVYYGDKNWYGYSSTIQSHLLGNIATPTSIVYVLIVFEKCCYMAPIGGLLFQSGAFHMLLLNSRKPDGSINRDSKARLLSSWCGSGLKSQDESAPY